MLLPNDCHGNPHRNLFTSHKLHVNCLESFILYCGKNMQKCWHQIALGNGNYHTHTQNSLTVWSNTCGSMPQRFSIHNYKQVPSLIPNFFRKAPSTQALHQSSNKEPDAYILLPLFTDQYIHSTAINTNQILTTSNPRS